MIGFRHSYGGYHRILKQYRKAGFDPALQAAKHHAEQFAHSDHNHNNGGVTGVTTPNSANSNREIAVMSPSDSLQNNGENYEENAMNKVAKHIRNKSDKLKDGMKSAFQKIQSAKDFILEDEDEDNNNDENSKKSDSGTVIVCSPSNDSSPSKVKRSQTYHQKYAQNNANYALSMEMTKTNTSMQHAKMPKMRKTQSLMKTPPENEENDDTIAPLQSSAFVAPNLGKSKTMHHSSSRIIKQQKSGLQRSGSSKNILLRHLDKKAFA